MESSSSFPHVVQVKYDVFISFRGKDIRDGFLSHLKMALKQKPIDVYIDGRLEGGDEISPVLLKAIEESVISLIIFSKDYASSTWCLDELVKITECMHRNKQIVIPVFYKVDPSHVRHIKGTYGDALAKHEKRSNENSIKVQNWTSALEKVANLSGFHSSNFGDEAELIENIVNCVWTRLNHMYQSDCEDLVGIDERIADIESFMSLESKDVRVIGIWGMGGIGKTTLAAVIFNRLCYQYEGCYFMANVRDELEKYGNVVNLKNKILSILLKENDLHIGTPNGVPPYVKRMLSRKKVLIVLDDVNDSEHLETLVGAHDWYGLGSRIIVTTRDMQVLGKIVDIIYEAKPLNSDESVQLFNLNAFKQTCLDMEWIELSKRVISYATGNPLALKVLGSFLYGKSKEEWQSQLQKLKKMPYAKIQAALRLSFDGLDREEKNIFLYIACYFKTTVEKDRIKYLLDACGYSTTIGLKDLQDKTLVSEVRSRSQIPYISMHDLIKEMGWEIVREECMEEPGKRSRLWDPQDIYPVLKNNAGTKAIQSITLDGSKIEELSLDPEVFSSMQELKFLSFSKPYVEEQILYLPQGLEVFPNKLRVFHWDSYPLKSLPSTFCAENLVEIKMSGSRVEKLWDGVVSLVKLKKVDLSNCKELVELPDLSMASNLEEVELNGCRNLHCVHPSILSLHKLVRLNLAYCRSLTSLKSGIRLSSLRYLSLSYCLRLKEFSLTSENMRDLNLASTAINELPSSIGSLIKLESLILDGCKSLKNLPNNLADMRSLRALRIVGCIQLDASNLRILLDGLWCLQELLLEECCNLFELPENICMLSSLRLLLLNDTDVMSLPASIKQLKKLEKLDLSGCRRLRFLPQLPSSIKEFYAYNCSSLETVEFTSEVAELVRENKIRFRFQNCVNLIDYSLKAIGVNAHFILKKMAYQHLSTIEEGKMLDCPLDVIYPGSEVPNWFLYRTSQASITIDIPSAETSKIWGFIFCVVVGRFPSNDKNFIGCDCYLESKESERGQMSLWSSIYAYEFISDHACLWFDDRFCLQAPAANDEYTTYSPKLVFEFFAQTNNVSDRRGDIMIKECGVCPVDASEYRDFIKEMELKLTFQTRAIETGVGKSNGRRDGNGRYIQTKEFKQHIFPHLPTRKWKNGTQGLKDIISLTDCLKDINSSNTFLD